MAATIPTEANAAERPTVPNAAEKPTVTVEEAGGWLDLGRTASYDAAARGDIPTIRIGRRLVVPTAALRRMLQLDPNGPDAPAA